MIALSGNKCDMETERKVAKEEAEEYAQENNLLYMETSAKAGINVKEIFVAIANKLPRKAKPEVKPLVVDNNQVGPAPKGNQCC